MERMNKHLESAKIALSRPGSRRDLDQLVNGMHKAIEDILKYLEEQERERSEDDLTLRDL